MQGTFHLIWFMDIFTGSPIIPNLLLHWLWDRRDSALLAVRLDTDDNNWLSRHGRDSSAPDRQGRPAQAQVATLEQRLCQEPIPRSVGSATMETRRLWLRDRGHRRNRNSAAAEWIRASGVKREKRRRQTERHYSPGLSWSVRHFSNAGDLRNNGTRQ